MEHHEALRVELAAGLITKGVRVVLPDGELSPQVQAVVTEDDDLGNPLQNRLMFDDGASLRVALTATVLVVAGAGAGLPVGAAAVAGSGDVRAEPPAGDAETASGLVVPPPPAPLPAPEEDAAVREARERIPAPELTPEQLIEDLAEQYPGRAGLQNLAERLTKGINVKSGSCLADLRAFSQDLFLEHQDAEGALAVADLLNVLPFDGNPARWTHTEASLALSSYLADQLGDRDRAERYRLLLKAPEGQSLDPFRSRLEAKIRQRRLNEPNLYDKEVFRAMDSGNHEAEREWRILRLESLLHLMAHGGSQTLAPDEVERRVRLELDLIRG
ncbi:DUF6707 family protein [Arthrobacter woluwensis]|uniref:Uncharacterized protein n=1 Tax=Arthrobacter woluwensis TaxID=156980 RepID=A0A1H4VUX2_9MICC|nr:DUF6707 family protein [Arthrobacter woluwensis]SEC84765.1 hypothetical protein SAMN04489745_3325 [Arthrobacter woluwensis]